MSKLSSQLRNGREFGPRPKLTPAQIAVRRRYIGATVVTCVVGALVGGTVHVLELGSNRMNSMRELAQIELEKEHEHIRAAGEELFRQTGHEHRLNDVAGYTVDEANALLLPEQWQLLEHMVLVPAGPFSMGTDSARTDAQNRPAHTVTLNAFEIDQHPVTNAQYARFVAATGHLPPLSWPNGRIPAGMELHPVTMVSFFNASRYAEWAGKRLPTEAEWEKAARGSDGRRWPWGEEMDPNKLNTYYRIGSTTRVGSFPDGASPYGALDMAGNVSEWTQSDFLPYLGSDAQESVFKVKIADIPEDPKERSLKIASFVETDSRYKVMRGGSWKSDPFSNATYHRNYAWPNAASDFFGFRCVRDVSEN